MKSDKQEAKSYTIEREYLSKITAAELVNRIIQSHVKKREGNEVTSP